MKMGLGLLINSGKMTFETIQSPLIGFLFFLPDRSLHGNGIWVVGSGEEIA